MEFWREPNLDAMIEDIIDIFKIEGVKLVRLSGMTKRANKVSGKGDIPPQSIDSIIRKLHANKIINVKYITKCPNCGEVSYQVEYDGVSQIGPKMCDSCNVFFQPLDGSSLEKMPLE